jgi:hypothetical protein
MTKHNTHVPTRRSRIWGRLAAVFAVASAFALLAVACGSDDNDAGGSGAPTVDIVSPADGAQVSRSFEVQLAINFPIGDPGTGREHVHLYYDGNTSEGEYGIAYDRTFTVTGLSPGEHTIQAVVAHADHSTTDSRSREIHVQVSDGDSGTGTTDKPPTRGGDGY